MESVTIGNSTPWVRIYAFCENATGEVRYVGKTAHYLTKRRKMHEVHARQHPTRPICRWIAKRKRDGIGYTMRLLENVPNDVSWQERESYWINRYRNEGHRLLNLTNGGEGLHGLRFTDIHKERIAAARRRGQFFACEECGTKFWRKPSEIKNGDCRFCSKQCYFVWQRGKTNRMPKRG